MELKRKVFFNKYATYYLLFYFKYNENVVKIRIIIHDFARKSCQIVRMREVLGGGRLPPLPPS